MLVMKDLFERILQILGTSRDSSLFQQLSTDLEDEPEAVIKHQYETVYLFRKTGFSISFDEVKGHYWHAFIHYGSAMTLSGRVTPYNGNLPAGILLGDDHELVEEKLEKRPLSSKYIQGSSPDDLKDLWDVYELSSFKITFIFRAPTEQLASVAIEC